MNSRGFSEKQCQLLLKALRVRKASNRKRGIVNSILAKSPFGEASEKTYLAYF